MCIRDRVITYQEPYEYYICTVKLKNKDLSHLPVDCLLYTSYKDAAEIISDNCDSVLFLSGRGKNAKEMCIRDSCCTYRYCLWIFRVRPFRAHPVFVLRKNLRNKS